jgi:ribose transport system ATP-binding protein
VVFAKWNNERTRILLLDEPTVGVDVGARVEIYGLIRDAARSGAGVLIVSSDLHELILLCDRISVVVDGRVIATLRRDEFGDAEHLHQFIQISQTEQGQAA